MTTCEIDRQTDRQTDRRADRQTDTELLLYMLTINDVIINIKVRVDLSLELISKNPHRIKLMQMQQ